MLEMLFGNQNIERILIFLFVNGKCYGTQLHKSLQTPLTPLQKALNRLEKGGLITSYHEGKTRLYQFNPGYPLIHELEQLIKKAYTLLPAHDKKKYYVMKEDPKTVFAQENKMKILLAFWEKLKGIKQITFHAKTKLKDEKRWNGKGCGEVVVKKENLNKIVFYEKGSWHGEQEGELSFSNIFCWTLDRNTGFISLEHFRRGPDHPVFLFHLSPTGKHTLSSIDAHLCEDDAYFGQIHFDRYSFRLSWRVIGPKKNEEIDYYYS